MDNHEEDSELSESDDESYSILPKKKCTEIRDCSGLFIYLKQHPKAFVACVTFLVSLACALALGASYAVGVLPHTCLFVAGIAGIVSNLYGFCHFRTLLNLKKEVDIHSTNNHKFAHENHLLVAEVNKFKKTKEALKATSKQIKDSVKRKQISLGKFRQLNTNLEAIGNNHLDILKDLNQMASAMEERWKEQLVVNERKILHICFDRFTWEEGHDGIYISREHDTNIMREQFTQFMREQFTQFKFTLPLEYQLRLTRVGDWETIAGQDGILQFEDTSKEHIAGSIALSAKNVEMEDGVITSTNISQEADIEEKKDRIDTWWITHPQGTDFKDVYQVGRQINREIPGQFSKAFRCKRRSDKKILAVKVIPKAIFYRA
eukprot:1068650_1